MAEGRSRALWGHTSSVLAMLVNVHRDPKRPCSPKQFNPYEVRKRSRARKRERHAITVSQLADEIMTLADRNGKK